MKKLLRNWLFPEFEDEIKQRQDKVKELDILIKKNTEELQSFSNDAKELSLVITQLKSESYDFDHAKAGEILYAVLYTMAHKIEGHYIWNGVTCDNKYTQSDFAELFDMIFSQNDIVNTKSFVRHEKFLDGIVERLKRKQV